MKEEKILYLRVEDIVVDHEGYCSGSECEITKSTRGIKIKLPYELAELEIGTKLCREDLPVRIIDSLETREYSDNGGSCYCDLEIPEEYRYMELERHTKNVRIVSAQIRVTRSK